MWEIRFIRSPRIIIIMFMLPYFKLLASPLLHLTNEVSLYPLHFDDF